MTPVLPLPNDLFGGSVVVASVWITDEGEEPSALVILLGQGPPYYTVGDLTWRLGAWHLSGARSHPNIVPAVEDYQQNGGDY